MATTLHSVLDSLRETKVWKSIFRRGPANTNRTRSLAVFGNLFLHWLPVKVREKSLRVRASYYLGSISFLLFIVLFVTGILLMFYYHPVELVRRFITPAVEHVKHVPKDGKDH